ncbi:hypothetical protein ACHAXS_003314 [Conticribra weissflogii]
MSPKAQYCASSDSVESEFRYYSRVCNHTTQSEKNINLSGPQKELLLWHWKLGCNISKIQEMMRSKTIKDEHGRETILLPVITPAFASTPSCPKPKCLACQLARAKKLNACVATQKPVQEQQDVLSWDRYVGDYVSTDQVTGLTPIEIATKTKTDHLDLLQTHVWGCPVFVLDPKQQDGKKIPKWNQRSRLVQFLGFSDEHSSLAANVRNLTTGYISPQFHLVFDDKFETVVGTGEDDSVVDAICN